MTIRSKSFLLRAVMLAAVFSVVLGAFYSLGFRPFKASVSSPVPPTPEEAASSSKISRSSVKSRPVTETDAKFRHLFQALQREDDETARVRAEGSKSIRGTVYEGSALNATIAVSPMFGATSEKSVILKSTKTDAQNNYVISGLADAEYIVSAGAPGCTTSSQERNLFFGSVDQCNFYLRRKGSGKTFKGTVVDATTSKPLEGAKIIVAQSVPVVSTITDKNGKFRLEDLEKKIFLEVFKDGYCLTEDSKSDPFTLQYTFNQESYPQETDTVIEMFPGAGSISGRVVDETSRPLHTTAQICLSSYYKDKSTSNSSKTMQNLNYWTNDRGEFNINGLPPNRDFGLYAIRGTSGEGIEVTLDPGEHKRDVELNVLRLVTVTGRTVDDDNGKPVPGVRILYYSLNHKEIQTGPDGEFSLLAEPRFGFFQCIALADGWRYAGSKDKETLVRIPVPKGAVKVDANIRMAAIPVIYGSVTVTDKPLQSATVHAVFQTQEEMKQVRGSTNQQGKYCLNLPSTIKKDSPILIFAGDLQGHGVVKLSKFNNNRTRVDLQMPDNTETEHAEFYMSDGKPLTETLSANYCFSFHSRNNDLRVDSNSFGFGDKTGGCSTIQTQWDDATIRLDLGDGKIVESPVNMQDIMKGPVRFIYDPVAEKITVSHEAAPTQ